MQDEEIIESINEGYVTFWTNPKHLWRRRIYEASKIETEIKDQHEIKTPQSVSRSEEDLLRESGLLRDMRMHGSS